MEEQLIVFEQTIQRAKVYRHKNLFSGCGDNFLYRVRAMPRSKNIAYGISELMSKNPKGHTYKNEPSITLNLGSPNGVHKFEKAGFCWSVKKADNEAIVKIKETEQKLQELRKGLLTYLKERWHDLSPLSIDDVKPLCKTEEQKEHLDKVFKQIKGEDKTTQDNTKRGLL